MKWLSALCLGACVALSGSVAVQAQDAKKDAKESKLSGKWERKASNWTVTFDFKKGDKLGVKIANDGGDSIDIEAAYTLDKEGLLKGTIEKVEAKGTDGPEKGEKFSFKVEAKADSLTIKDLDSKGGDEVKQIVQGEYKKLK